MPSSSKKISDIPASKCWPVWIMVSVIGLGYVLCYGRWVSGYLGVVPGNGPGDRDGLDKLRSGSYYGDNMHTVFCKPPSRRGRQGKYFSLCALCDLAVSSFFHQFFIKPNQLLCLPLPVVFLLHRLPAAPAHGFGFCGMIQNPLHGFCYGIRIERIY